MFRPLKMQGMPLLIVLLIASVLMAGCGYEPDTSAPDRVEIERSRDWRGALLYIADSNGPTEERGSVRVYDNVSGFVEITVEQTRAAAPSDVYVSEDGSSMYVASGANGLVDRFSWDGNAWVSGSFEIETPSTSLLTLNKGPDGNLYAVDASPLMGARIFAIDPATNRVLSDHIAISNLSAATGIAWSGDGAFTYIAGRASGTEASMLTTATWPFSQVTSMVELPIQDIGQLVTSPDGLFVYVMGRGEVLKVEAASGAVAASLRPAAEAATTYSDGDFSADGVFLFVCGTAPGSDSTLYVIDLQTSQVVETVEHISRTAGGIQRVE